MTAAHEISRVVQVPDQLRCQVPDCLRRAARVVEIELPAAWEPTATYRTLTVHAGFCLDHGRDVERRVTDLLEARDDLHNLLVIVEAAALARRGFRTAGGVV